MNLEIPGGRFAAVLYDCDGTLVDSMPLHYAAWCAGLEAAGAPYPFSEQVFYANAGIKDELIVEKLNREYGAEVDPTAVVTTKREVFESRFHELQGIPAVIDHARSVVGSTPLAVVSGSEALHVQRCLEVVGIADLFQTVVTPQDVPVGKGKPFPDMFLLAAQRLQVAPESCLVFEDGQSGIDAASSAGMMHVFVPSAFAA